MGGPANRTKRIYEKLKLSKAFQSHASKLKRFHKSKNLDAFKKEINNINDLLIDRFGIYASELHSSIISKILGKESHDYFPGISHHIDKSPYEDISYSIAYIKIKPGVSKKELGDYIKKHYKKIELELKSSLNPNDLEGIRPRATPKLDRNKKILKLHKKGLSDRDISSELNLGGKLSLARKAISDMKKKSL